MKGGKALVRPSYYEWMIHQQDVILNLGFDYENKLLEKTVSNYMLVDPEKEFIFKQFQILIVYLINATGNIRKAYNYTVPKNYKMRA